MESSARKNHGKESVLQLYIPKDGVIFTLWFNCQSFFKKTFKAAINIQYCNHPMDVLSLYPDIYVTTDQILILNDHFLNDSEKHEKIVSYS